MSYTVERYHDISAGHRVVGHENKCRHLHGHNFRIRFTCASDPGHNVDRGGLDSVGRVVDFGVIKSVLCQWIEDNWDHKMLMWVKDPLLQPLVDDTRGTEYGKYFRESIVLVSFNPTAENMAEYLVNTVGPILLEGSGVRLLKVVVEETRKCSASYTRREQ